eukprot:TRINITY_DN18713_c0_g1_i2.p1 TRINITY_DN18713_c0_g1~~TRINITY_DN18713_c0_g1_i2.p1  ORF type:complete len:177 (-),score=40.26 TRINITY_DN18713_c0_g1_i2:342-872(-)
MCIRDRFMKFYGGWDLSDSAYWAALTLSTFGGKMPRVTWECQLFGTIYIVVGVPLFVMTFAKISDGMVDWLQIHASAWLLEHGLSPMTAAFLDKDGTGTVDWEEYLEAMVVRLGYMNPQQLDQIRRSYDQLRASSSGHCQDFDESGTKQSPHTHFKLDQVQEDTNHSTTLFEFDNL